MYSITDNPDAYCQLNPTAKVADPNHCGRYFDCARPDSRYGRYKQECQYPKVFSMENQDCLPFKSVQCGNRYEPFDACMY